MFKIEQLKILRERDGLTQEDLAELLGLDRSAVTKWESGVAKPKYENLIQLSKIFNCTLDELVGNEAKEDV